VVSMSEWLELNKQWVFSGAGVAVLVGVVSVLSATVTFLVKTRSEKKKRKQLSLRHELKQYRVEAAGEHDPLTVSYKGKPYEHLCQFSVVVENTGSPGIDSQQLLFRFPVGVKVLDVYEHFSTQTISTEIDELQDDNRIEHLRTINRLEPGDVVSFTYMLDTDRTEEIVCEPRGVDDIDYAYTGTEEVPDTRKLITFAALFVLVGVIPILGTALRAGVIILATPTIMAVINRMNKQRNPAKTCVIRDVTVEDTGQIRVFQE